LEDREFRVHAHLDIKNPETLIGVAVKGDKAMVAKAVFIWWEIG
jgi:hypothetical protein